jgi:hypothetical protein
MDCCHRYPLPIEPSRVSLRHPRHRPVEPYEAGVSDLLQSVGIDRGTCSVQGGTWQHVCSRYLCLRDEHLAHDTE